MARASFRTLRSDDTGGADVRDEQLRGFVAAARVRSVIDDRRRTRWLRRQLHEDLSLVALCHDLVDSAEWVDLEVAGCRTHRGQLQLAGDDFVAMWTAPAGDTYIRVTAIVAVRPLPDAAPAAPAAMRPSGPTFDDVLVDWSERRPRVSLGTADGRIHEGVLTGVGRDVVVLDDGGTYLRADAITDGMAR